MENKRTEQLQQHLRCPGSACLAGGEMGSGVRGESKLGKLGVGGGGQKKQRGVRDEMSKGVSPYYLAALTKMADSCCPPSSVVGRP